MNIKITRSFDKKIQLKQFEPASWFCSAEVEVPIEEAQKWSEKLDMFVQAEVAKARNLWEFVKPPSKWDFKKDYKKIYFSEKSIDIGVDDAENDTNEDVPPGTKLEN